MFKSKKIKSDKNEYKHIKMPKGKISLKSRIINNIKLFIKDLKRTRWTDLRSNYKTFLKVVLFIVITSLILYGMAIGFSSLWNALGVGLND